MTGGAWVLLVVAAAFAVADWVAAARENRPLEYVAKPATLIALIGVALLLDPDDGAVRAWFVVALAFSLVGDVLLMLPRDLFVGGLAAFLLGHVAYVVGLNVAGTAAGGWVVGITVVLIAIAVVGRRVVAAVRAGDEPKLTAPVVTYMLVISAMVASAIATGEPLAIAGAVLFYASDSLIAWNRFVRALAWAPVAIMVTYHLGQAGLVLSLT